MDLNGMMVMLTSEHDWKMTSALTEIAYTKEFNGMNFEGATVFAYVSDFSTEYRVSKYDPSFLDKFCLHINLDEGE